MDVLYFNILQAILFKTCVDCSKKPSDKGMTLQIQNNPYGFLHSTSLKRSLYTYNCRCKIKTLEKRGSSTVRIQITL